MHIKLSEIDWPRLRWVAPDRVTCDDPRAYPRSFVRGAEYRAEIADDDFIRVIDESGEDYLWPRALVLVKSEALS